VISYWKPERNKVL